MSRAHVEQHRVERQFDRVVWALQKLLGEQPDVICEPRVQPQLGAIRFLHVDVAGGGARSDEPPPPVQPRRRRHPILAESIRTKIAPFGAAS